MLFTSKLYLALFLPLTVFLYYRLSKTSLPYRFNIIFLALAGFVFYASWKSEFIILIMISILINFSIGVIIDQTKNLNYRYNLSKLIMITGIIFNVLLLTYYKYVNFFIHNLNYLFTADLPNAEITLPLGISFFTFTQIAYLVDKYNNNVSNDRLDSYILFVNFFPHLLAGPIIHHKEMMSQFSDIKNRFINWDNCYKGLLLLIIGLFKKVCIADYFGEEVNYLYKLDVFDFYNAWLASLSYSLQLYFDFSGYSDMAIGSALFFNIHLPINFNSPYKATSIQDFWKRWHITLGRFLKNYIYIPLGGNKKGSLKTYINLFLTFAIGGIWHGAGWTFLIWGALHGFASVIHRFWSKLKISLNKFVAVFITFMFVNFCWIFFRAESFNKASQIINSMLHPGQLFHISSYQITLLSCVSIGLLAVFSLPNSQHLVDNYYSRKISPYIVSMLGALSIARLFVVQSSFFLYFQF